MKVMKLLASCAMVGTLAAVCASGVFAAEPVKVDTLCSDYVAAEGEAEGTGSVTVTMPAQNVYANTGDYTVLVLDEAGNTAAKIEDSNIKQIDQVVNSTASLELKFSGLTAGSTYYVRLGGAESGYIYDTFTVADESEPPTPTRAKGDVVGTVEGEINANDILAVKQISVGIGTWSEEQLCAADVVGTVESEVNSNDVLAIMQVSVGLDVTFKE